MGETPSHRVSDPHREPRGGALDEQSTSATTLRLSTSERPI